MGCKVTEPYQTLNSREYSLAVRRREISFVVERDPEEHTSELQSHSDLVCRLLLEKKKKT